MITGRLPFVVHEGRSGAVDQGALVPTLDDLPSPLRPLVASAVSPEPEARPRNAEVLLERLVAVEGALAPRPRPRWHGRSVMAAVAALVAGVSALAVWRVTKPPRPAPGEAEGRAAESGGAAVPSLDAYAHYFRAVEAADDGRLEQATAELDRALELDPEFPLAHYYRAHLGEFSGVPMSIRRAQVEAALRFSDRLPTKERHLVRAWGAHVRGDDAEAGRIYRTAVENFPDDPDVLYFAGDFLFHAGDLESSAGLFQRAMDARPGWPPPLAHLVETFDGLGRLDQVLGPLRRAVATAPSEATYSALGNAYLAMGELEEAVRALRAAVAAGGGPATILRLGDRLLYASRLDAAEAEARRLIAPEIPPRMQLAGYQLLIEVRAFQGRHREALRLLDEIPAAVRAASQESAQRLAVGVLTFYGADPERLWLESRRWGSQLAAFHLAYAGDLAHASELARGLGSGPDRDLYEGLVAWRRGQPDAAVRRLRSATRPGANTRSLASVFLAGVLSELGRDEDALDALRVAWRHSPNLVIQLLLHPRTLLIAARSLERLGRRDEALARIDELLALWKDADPDLPALAEARALRGRLVSSGGRARR
jgi:tetratricopeptide (TPR) repeat protein